MKRVDIHGAPTHLARLVDAAAKGEPFVIARSGKPMVKVVALDSPAPGKVRRLGFLAGGMVVPDDFDTLAAGLRKLTKRRRQTPSEALLRKGRAER